MYTKRAANFRSLRPKAIDAFRRNKTKIRAFGADFEDWVNVKCVIKDKIAEIFVNDASAIKLRVTGGRARMVEIGYRFQGTGSVDFVKLTNNNGEVFYEEDFNK